MNIKVYSTPTCSWCKRVKNFLVEKGVEFEYIDVSTDHEAAHEMIDKSGQLGVPVIDIDNEIIVGFNRDALEKALKK